MATAETAPHSRVGSWLRLALIGIALWVCMLAWALSSPPGSAPDEDAHLSAAWAIAHGQSANAKTWSVPAVFLPKYCHPSTVLKGPCFNAPSKIGSSRVEFANRTIGYPVTFHWLEGKFFDSSLNASVLWIRAFVSLVCAFLIMLPLLLIKVIAGDRALRTVGLLLVVSLSPLAFFMFGSVNPSSWEMAGAVCSWGSFVALVLATRWIQVPFAVIGIVIGILAGALARPHGGLLLLLALPLAGPLALARIAPAAAAARRRFWLAVIGCYVVVGSVASVLIFRGALSIRWDVSAPRDTHSALWHWLSDAPRSGDYLLSSFGPLGWLDTPIPSIVPLLVVAVGGYLVLGALRQGRITLTLSLLMTTVGSLFLTTAVLATGIPPDGHLESRYLWPVYIGVLFTTAAGLLTADRPSLEELLGGHVRLLLSAALVVAGVVGFFTNVRRYATGLGEFPYVSPLLWRPSVLGFTPLLVVFVVAYAFLVYLVMATRLPSMPRRRLKVVTSEEVAETPDADPRDAVDDDA
jgi:Predicted membrane protein (DUF2142)